MPRWMFIGGLTLLFVTPVMPMDGVVEQGCSLYQGTCVVCHGVNGKGQLPGVPDFTRPDSPLRKSDDVLFGNIEQGFQSPGSTLPMPAKGGNPSLDADGIRAVIRYLRETFQSTPYIKE